MQNLRDAADGLARLLVRAGASVWLLLAIAVAAAAVDAATIDRAPSRASSGPRSLLLSQHRAERPATAAVHQRPRLHHSTASWVHAAPLGHQLRAPADAIVDPFGERWQFEAVEATAEPQLSDQPGLLLRMDGARDAPVRGPYLVRAFPRPPPSRL